MSSCVTRWLAFLPFLAFAAATSTAGEDRNLLAWDPSQPDGGWSRWSPRQELAPTFALEEASGSGPSLLISGAGRRHVSGGWRRSVSGIVPGTLYAFEATVEARGLVSLRRGLVCHLRWTGDSLGVEFSPVYAGGLRSAGPDQFEVTETYLAPDGATGAQVSLLLHESPEAELAMRSVSLKPAGAFVPRRARIATVYWRPSGPSTPERNLEAFASLVDRAAAQRPDLILLPEAITTVGAGVSVTEAARWSAAARRTLSACARRHAIYVVYGAYEAGEDGTVFNVAFVIGRDGSPVGSYRKVQLPVEEVEAGLSPGDEFRVFDLDFGRVGLLICHDTAFPEPARVLALQGAEILLVPIWGGDLTQLRARALDNGVWVVTSGYDVASALIDPAGAVLASTWKDPDGGTAQLTIELGSRFRRPWIGDWRSATLKQRRTDAYRRLVEE